MMDEADRERGEGCPGPEELSALLDGDLPVEEEACLQAHLAGCAACRAATEELGALRVRLPGLAVVEPPRDLWPAIRRARRRELRAEAGGFRGAFGRAWLLPAGALAGAAAAALVFFLAVGLGPDRPAPALQALVAVQSAERTYQDAIAGLEQALEGDQAELAPEVRATIRKGLEDIDAVIARCRQVLRDAPDDLAAHRAMLAAYQHKVDFLTELVGESL
jgi:anti-sigma factor RsiW